jgi:hypothetical protein
MQNGARLRVTIGAIFSYGLAGTLVACAPAADGLSDNAGGSAVAAAGSSGSATNAGGASAGTAGGSTAGGSTAGAAAACPEARELLRPSGTLLELGFAPMLAGKPFVLGEPNPMAGGQVSPLNFRFYVSELSLVAADGSLLAVDLVSPAGKAEPYGVHLVDFEDPQSTSLHVLAPPGTYNGARFTFGLNDACNSGDSSRSAPLSFNSQMVWPHVAGFLFLRDEATWTAGGDAAAPKPPSMIHMGGTVGSVFAPQAKVAGTLSVPTTGTVTRTIQISFDEIFRGASSAEDVSNVPFPTDEVIAGERLRRAVPTLEIFKLTEP